jgi:hypothetical protein
MSTLSDLLCHNLLTFSLNPLSQSLALTTREWDLRLFLWSPNYLVYKQFVRPHIGSCYLLSSFLIKKKKRKKEKQFPIGMFNLQSSTHLASNFIHIFSNQVYGINIGRKTLKSSRVWWHTPVWSQPIRRLR